ncbi:hypothetical protein [Maribacter sp. 2308TA10-17]|uniref:hypothetical protein n=1 Tax=Maribacter sp. 2308TA10-17 TaxID=3386276 RepID=UPI0039BD8665
MGLVNRYIFIITDFFNKKGGKESGYENATNLLCMYSVFLIMFIVVLSLKVYNYSTNNFKSIVGGGAAEFIFTACLIFYVFAFSALFKNHIKEVYENLINEKNSIKNRKLWNWIVFLTLPFLVFSIVYLYWGL